MKQTILLLPIVLTFLLPNTYVRAQTDKTATSIVQPNTAISANHEALDKRIHSEISQFKGKVSLFAKNLETGVTYEFGGDDRVPTASTIKVAVMIETFARVAEGKAKWTDELVLTKEKKAGGSGILPVFTEGLHLTLRDARA
jgi:beta-lactamase class A